MKPKLERSPNFRIKTARSSICIANYAVPHVHNEKVIKTKDGTYEGSVNNLGQRHGRGIMTYNWGDVYDGEFHNNAKQGRGIFLFKTKSFYFGEWRNGAYHGPGILRDRHNNVFEGKWESGLKEGNGIFYYSDGRVEVNYFRGNFPTGQGVRWSADGGTAWSLMDGNVVKKIAAGKALKLAFTNNLKIPRNVDPKQYCAAKPATSRYPKPIRAIQKRRMRRRSTY